MPTIVKPLKDTRGKYNPVVLAQQNLRNERYFRIHEVFTPNIRIQPITGKFYSPHEKQDLSKADEDLLNKIRKCKEFTPTQKYSAPVTESHKYGWYPGTLTPLLRRDSRFFQPKINSISYLWEVSGFTKRK